MVDARVVAAAVDVLAGAGSVLTPSDDAARALVEAGVAAIAGAIEGASDVDAVALIDDELSAAGDHAEGLIDAAVEAVRPGGVIVVSALSPVHNAAGAGRSFTADALRRALGHRGVDVDTVCAPGAAALVAGDAGGGFDSERDRMPGLLDAGPRVVVAGRTPRSPGERTSHFFTTLPFKVVAAAVLCRDDEGRLLVVHDSFKRAWTIPGGVVDADEDPQSAAVREAWEEAGVRVRAGAVLGVFSASWPDRVILVYEGHPIGSPDDRHAPVHAHEIDDVAWVDLDDALERLAPHVAQQVRYCLDHPGGTLRQRFA